MNVSLVAHYKQATLGKCVHIERVKEREYPFCTSSPQNISQTPSARHPLVTLSLVRRQTPQNCKDVGWFDFVGQDRKYSFS